MNVIHEKNTVANIRDINSEQNVGHVCLFHILQIGNNNLFIYLFVKSPVNEY